MMVRRQADLDHGSLQLNSSFSVRFGSFFVVKIGSEMKVRRTVEVDFEWIIHEAE